MLISWFLKKTNVHPVQQPPKLMEYSPQIGVLTPMKSARDFY